MSLLVLHVICVYQRIGCVILTTTALMVQMRQTVVRLLSAAVEDIVCR